jgi:cardiolipin synthase A/B
VGSANLDVRSFRLNFELIAVLYDEGIVKRIESLFEEDAAKAIEVTLGAWMQRGLGSKLKEGLGRLLAPML